MCDVRFQSLRSDGRLIAFHRVAQPDRSTFQRCSCKGSIATGHTNLARFLQVSGHRANAWHQIAPGGLIVGKCTRHIRRAHRRGRVPLIEQRQQAPPDGLVSERHELNKHEALAALLSGEKVARILPGGSIH